MTGNNNDLQLENLITDSSKTISEIEENDVNNFIDNPFENSWTMWGKQILNDVKSSITSEEGDRINPYYFPQIVKRLLIDIRLLPLWTNISRDRFGYGRIPASSASVESEFNKLKSLLLKDCPSLRIDSFIQKHVNYLHGILKIVDAQKEKLDSNKSCPACQNDDKPSGAHVCYLCTKKVHALPECSSVFGDVEEGYGQPRICIMCKNVKHVKNILESREIENWGGLEKSNPSKSNALYLGKNPHKIIDALTCKKAGKIPIMKNGNNLSLKDLKVKDDNYTIANTCAFDSIFQILLAAGHDFKDVLLHMEKIAEINMFCKLIVHTIKNGITPYSYKLRAQILLEIFPISNAGGSKYVNCETNVGYLAIILFKDVPSFEETSHCDSGCSPRYKKLPVIQIEESQITVNDFDDLIKQSVSLEGKRRCCSEGCLGYEKTSLSETGM